MEAVRFDTVNIYDSINYLTARSPEDLCTQIRAIQTPIKIISIVSDNGRFTAFIQGDVRIKRKKTIKGELDNVS
jgi:hypothetical protein